jgi:phosphoglycolate phosphatase-like HAD superfamily hydrolase
VGDRPHDLAAARAAGLPFLAIGTAVPGEHTSLEAEVEAEALVRTVEALLRAT